MLQRLPVMLTRQTRTGTYGSWYNYYLCDFDGAIILPDLPNVPPAGHDLSSHPGQPERTCAFHSTAEEV